MSKRKKAHGIDKPKLRLLERTRAFEHTQKDPKISEDITKSLNRPGSLSGRK
jgi:hypothetical protein